MITMKKITWTELTNEYKNPYTLRKYKCVLRPFLVALQDKHLETCVIEDEEYVVFKTQKVYDDFIKKIRDVFQKESMKHAFVAVFNGLVKRFYLPQPRNLSVHWEPKAHKGLKASERKALIDYCSSDKDDYEHLMCLAKFTAMVLIDTGVRGFEFNMVVEQLASSDEVNDLIRAIDINHLTTKELKNHPKFKALKGISIRGKLRIPREINITPRMIKLWKKVIDHHQEKIWKTSSVEQIRYRLRKVVTKLGIEATTHDFRVCFASDYYRKTRDLSSLRLLMGHKNVNQTDKYVRIEQDHDKTIAIIDDELSVDQPRIVEKLEDKFNDLEKVVNSLSELLTENAMSIHELADRLNKFIDVQQLKKDPENPR